MLGAGWELWQLDGEGNTLLAQQPTSGAALADAARDLTRGCLARLDVPSAAWLQQKMRDGRRDEMPSHFRIVLEIEQHEAWRLAVVAHHSGGGACQVAELGGVVEQPAHQVAA